MAEEYESRVEIEKNPTRALVEIIHLDSQKKLYNLTCLKKFKITSSN